MNHLGSGFKQNADTDKEYFLSGLRFGEYPRSSDQGHQQVGIMFWLPGNRQDVLDISPEIAGIKNDDNAKN